MGALVAAVGLLVLAVFQAALALGAPLGRAAWGGAHERLPTGLRVGSAIAVVVWLLAALIVLGRAGYDVVQLPDPVLRWGPWVLVVLLLVGAVMNFASKGPWERYGWGPLAFLLSVLCLTVALSP